MDKFEKFKDLLKKHPERIIEFAVHECCKTKLGAVIEKKLKVYAGSEHPHSAQKPVIFESQKN